MTGHGSAASPQPSFQRTRFCPHVIEAQPAHQERDEASAAHNHAPGLQERCPMLWWADYLDKARKGADVIELHARR